ncbi:MAG: hypothetical protein ACKVIY_01140 [Acidimicrobiales bacterium]
MSDSRQAAWDVLTDFPNISDWDSGLKASKVTGGAQRPSPEPSTINHQPVHPFTHPYLPASGSGRPDPEAGK